MCERWHPETSSFHLPMREISITLDDVADLLHILIEGRLFDYEKKVSQERGVELMVRWLGVSKVVAVKACKDEFDAYITYTSLKELYEAHLTVATKLEVPQSRSNLQEREGERERGVCSVVFEVFCYISLIVRCSLIRRTYTLS